MPSPSVSAANTPDTLRPIRQFSQDRSPFLTSSTPCTYSLAQPAEPTLPHSEKEAENYIFPPSLPLTTTSARTDNEINAALNLVAEGVLEQRQIAAKCVVYHPVVLAISLIVFLSVAKLLYTGLASDYVFMVALWAGYGLVGLTAVRHLVGQYLKLAEKAGSWSWLSEGSVNGISQRRDEILVTKSGDEVVGVVVLRTAKTVTGAGTPHTRIAGVRSSRRKSSARWTGIIRAWTVKAQYRQQGIGASLLKEAVSYSRLRALDGPMFADDHANAGKVLPPIFNSKFEEQENWARSYLERIIFEQKWR